MKPAVSGDDVERQPTGQGRFPLFRHAGLGYRHQPWLICAVKESSAIKDLIALDLDLVRGEVGGCCCYTSNSHIASPSDRSVPSP
ncbi:hypothetical protein DXT97_06070 [Agrobacterium tumefaciens]|nr:hypothetical protein [Agrobacterium tumefaciens]